MWAGRKGYLFCLFRTVSEEFFPIESLVVLLEYQIEVVFRGGCLLMNSF